MILSRKYLLAAYGNLLPQFGDGCEGVYKPHLTSLGKRVSWDLCRIHCCSCVVDNS